MPAITNHYLGQSTLERLLAKLRGPACIIPAYIDGALPTLASIVHPRIWTLIVGAAYGDRDDIETLARLDITVERIDAYDGSASGPCAIVFFDRHAWLIEFEAAAAALVYDNEAGIVTEGASSDLPPKGFDTTDPTAK